MTIIDRDQHISEYIIREHVRKRIKKSLAEKALVEEKIRTAVRIILEAETGTAEPSKHTGINVLADLLEKIIPIIDSDYKMLTTSKEQRDSFRNHMVHAIKNSLRPIGAANESDVDKLPENIVFEIDTDLLSEKIKIDLTPDEPSEDSSVEGEFIDIDAPEEGEDFGAGLEDQNETGRNFAAASFKKIEKQIVDAYDMLADEEDPLINLRMNLLQVYQIQQPQNMKQKKKKKIRKIQPTLILPKKPQAKKLQKKVKKREYQQGQINFNLTLP